MPEMPQEDLQQSLPSRQNRFLKPSIGAASLLLAAALGCSDPAQQEGAGGSGGADTVVVDCHVDPASSANLPPKPAYPLNNNEIQITPYELTNPQGNITAIVPTGYEQIAAKTLADLEYCMKLVPQFVCIKPYWSGAIAKTYITQNSTNAGSYGGNGLLLYARSQANIDMDLQAIQTNDPSGFYYHSSPTYCANSHEFTHWAVSDRPIPLWANEGVAEYSQKFNQAGSKDEIACSPDHWSGKDYWVDDQYKDFAFSNLSQPAGNAPGDGSKWYHTAMCLWENFDKQFGAEKRREVFYRLGLYNGEVKGDLTQLFVTEFMEPATKDQANLEVFLTTYGFHKGVDY